MSVCIPVDFAAPAFIQVPTGTQDGAEPSQPGVFPTRITRTLPNGGQKRSSNTDPPMGDGAGAEHKALPKLGALTGLPLLVALLVLGQVRAPGEALPTLRTLIGPLPGVDAPMGSEVGVAIESLPAVRAVEGPLLCVNPLMSEATGAGLKPLPHTEHS